MVDPKEFRFELHCSHCDQTDMQFAHVAVVIGFAAFNSGHDLEQFLIPGEIAESDEARWWSKGSTPALGLVPVPLQLDEFGQPHGGGRVSPPRRRSAGKLPLAVPPRERWVSNDPYGCEYSRLLAKTQLLSFYLTDPPVAGCSSFCGSPCLLS